MSAARRRREADEAPGYTRGGLRGLRLVLLVALAAGGILASTRTRVSCERDDAGQVGCAIARVADLGGGLALPWRTERVEAVREVVVVSREEPRRREGRHRSQHRYHRLEIRGDGVLGHDEGRDLAPLRSFLAQADRRSLSLARPRDPRLAVASVLLLGTAALMLLGWLVEATIGRERLLGWFGFDAWGRELDEDAKVAPWQRAVGVAGLLGVAALVWFFVGGGHRRFGPEAVHLVSAIHAASGAGDVEAARRALEAGVDPDATDDQERSPLLIAARSGATGVVQLLLEAGASPDWTTLSGETPLHLAAARGDAAMVAALAQAGADPNALDGSGWSVLSRAAESGDPERVRAALAAGADPRRVEPRGWTALQHAAIAGPAVVEVLLEAGADPEARNENGATAWDLGGAQPGVRELLEQHGR